MIIKELTTQKPKTLRQTPHATKGREVMMSTPTYYRAIGYN
jgi:hypothetical protein